LYRTKTNSGEQQFRADIYAFHGISWGGLGASGLPSSYQRVTAIKVPEEGRRQRMLDRDREGTRDGEGENGVFQRKVKWRK